jgi:DNA polymerase
VKPRAIVCLGATAAQALLGRDFKVSKQRGVPVDSDLAPVVLATVHPSSILRAPDEAAGQEALDGLISDLRAASKQLDTA